MSKMSVISQPYHITTVNRSPRDLDEEVASKAVYAPKHLRLESMEKWDTKLYARLIISNRLIWQMEEGHKL